MEAGSVQGYGQRLLGALGVEAALPRHAHEPHRAFATSGVMALTGDAGGPPRAARAAIASCMDEAALAFTHLVERERPLAGAALLGERAAFAGLSRRGPIAPGGACRLIAARDARLAVNLARDDDRAALGAWLEDERDDGDPWERVAAALPHKPAAHWLERAGWLSLPVATATPPATDPASWVRVSAVGRPGEARSVRGMRVVDLSSLWAGPLCTGLLAEAGARVLKVECRRRPDAAREGSPAFFDLLHAGKRSARLDLGSDAGRAALRRLVETADLVVESARPRALPQLGLDARTWLAARPGRTWLSITGHGREGADAQRVAFGDDAAIAAGAGFAAHHPGLPIFCGDALADPLTGLHAAVAAAASRRAGGGALLDVSLRAVTSHVLAQPAGPAPIVTRSEGAWVVGEGPGGVAVAPPRARAARGRAAVAGADTATALDEARAAACRP